MLTQSEFLSIDTDYFSILEKTPLYVRIQSKNTRHFWKIYCPGFCQRKSKYLIQHAHGVYDGFHDQGYTDSFQEAIDSIIHHDSYQYNNRPHVRRSWDEYSPTPLETD